MVLMDEDNSIKFTRKERDAESGLDCLGSFVSRPEPKGGKVSQKPTRDSGFILDSRRFALVVSKF